MGVGLGVFGLGLFFFIFNSFPFLVRGCASSMFSWPISLENFPELLYPYATSQNQQIPAQEKAGRSISVTDSIFEFSFDSADQFQM